MLKKTPSALERPVGAQEDVYIFSSTLAKPEEFVSLIKEAHTDNGRSLGVWDIHIPKKVKREQSGKLTKASHFPNNASWMYTRLTP